ncbi:hypothetical protein EZS27_016101 [termite gut metagenome]|uniref:Uncharacterized protein n=1 Tax=termite gut metagenome TaxID=433724 RepID=A0A5J4RRT9_9ZZZZ
MIKHRVIIVIIITLIIKNIKKINFTLILGLLFKDKLFMRDKLELKMNYKIRNES